MKIQNIYTLLAACLITVHIIAQDSGSLLIKNGTVLTVTNGTLENTDVLIEDGKIARIAKNINARDIETVDATGK